MAAMDDDFDLVDSDDYYAWLGLNKDASPDEINNAFRRLSRIYHPDKHATNPENIEKAQSLFAKIRKAHDVLANPDRKAIYDTMGVKGLETDGWEIVSRTKTPQEILEEYERLQQEREARRLEQSTNPKGSISVGIDATDLFDRYDVFDSEYSSLFPHIEISNMSLSQSVECPLTTKDTAVLAGSLSSRNGRGHGNIAVTGRRLLSKNGWAEVEIGAGEGASIAVRGFRTLWRRGFGTMSGSLQLNPHGNVSVIRPMFQTMVATQLDKNIQGRMTWNMGRPSSLATMILYDNENHHLNIGIQLGIPATTFSAHYTRKFIEAEAKVKGSIRAGTTFGVVAEYGCEKKITKFSTLGAAVSVGMPLGVTLKIKLNRGNQTFVFPIHLAEEIVPSAVFYGTFIPLATFFAVKVLIVKPFLDEQKQAELKKKKDANFSRMAEKKHEAELAVQLMTETVERIVENETKRGGLLIRKALYGKLEGDAASETDLINVTVQLQAMVKDSKLLIPDGTRLNEMPGFYDPCVGEEKELSVTYEFRRQLHMSVYKDTDKVLLPNRQHLVDSNNSSDSSR